MPLGGTSNHFRTAVLHAICGWDPFNVTEDADIGIRLAALGYRVAMLDSTTHEEAPERIGAWVRQRSRWLKGYMQTWLVHTRCVPQFVRQAGLRGCLSFHLFIGGTVLSALINPLLWISIIAEVVLAPRPFADSPHAILALAFLASNIVLTLVAVTGARGEDARLAPHGAMIVLYWLLISVAGYRALWQLIVRPFHWEKTQHGLSLVTRHLALLLAAFAFCHPDDALAGAWTQERGTWFAISSFDLTHAAKGFDGDGKPDAPVRFDKAYVKTLLEYGLTRRLTLFAVSDYIRARAAWADETPVKARDASFEAGARFRLADWHGPWSAQASYRAAGPFDLSNSIRPDAARIVEARILYGTNFALLGRDGFADVEAAQRWISHPRPSETALDVTAGFWVTKTTMAMIQSFNIISGGNAPPPYTYFRTHKVQLSLVQALSPRWSLQIGGFISPAGQNSLVEQGLTMSLWVRR